MMNEVTIGMRIGEAGNVEVRVYEDNVGIPHFHCINKSDRTIVSYVRLDAPEYLSNHNKNKLAKLSDEDEVAVAEWLKCKNEYVENITNYDMACILWNSHNAEQVEPMKEINYFN